MSQCSRNTHKEQKPCCRGKSFSFLSSISITYSCWIYFLFLQIHITSDVVCTKNNLLSIGPCKVKRPQKQLAATRVEDRAGISSCGLSHFCSVRYFLLQPNAEHPIFKFPSFWGIHPVLPSFYFYFLAQKYTLAVSWISCHTIL